MTGTTAEARKAPATAAADLLVVGAALLLTALAAGIWGLGRQALATSLGGTVAVGNWLALRWLTARLMSGAGRRRGVLAVLFGLKIVVLLGAVWALVRFAALEPLPLALGYSALVVGLIGAGFLAGRDGAAGGGDA
jgi:hypothetical protein